jgi:carotenoid 1,2-hydratase
LRGPPFDVDVASGGYAWWYVDALSDCGRYALTVIAFVGSVFSPWYARSRRTGDADPLRHGAINVALHGPEGDVWVFNERPLAPGARSTDRLVLDGASGGTTARWEDGRLVLRLDEPSKPFFERMAPRLRGEIRLTPGTLHGRANVLDAAGVQRWHCVAPGARVSVDLEAPRVRFEGTAYHDANHGDVALEASFRRWSWCRAPLPEGTAVLYDTVGRDGVARPLGWLFRQDGATEPLAPAEVVELGRARWGVARRTRTESAAGTRLVRTLEASPFYARSLVAMRLRGRDVTAFHESLDLDRFSSAWVRFLLPWRIRREGGRHGA